jgi:signal transduction histidine kinase/AmiR/NasT family two-component response regulator
MLKGIGRWKNSDSLSDLIAAVERLGDQRVARLFRSFGEENTAVARVGVLTFVLVWVLAWCYGPQPILVADAWSVLPWAISILAVSVLWLLAIRAKLVPSGPWVDGVGLAANLIFITIFAQKAFYLLISANALLPFSSIAVAVRFGNRMFYACLALTLVILFTAGPSGYWIGRPAYAIYAVALTVALPMLIERILNALRYATLQSIRAREAQTRFIGTISHELRTPLNSLTNCAVLIDPETMKPEGRALLQAVTYNASALLHRVNDVLDIAALDGGQLRLQPESLRIDELVRTVHAICNVQADETKVRLVVEVANGADLAVIGDGGRMEQALTNLVSNAIKFSPGGEVALKVSGSALHSSDMVELTFVVADNGVGIPSDQKERVFEPFRQLDQGPGRAHGGVGLGLYIVRKISDLMGGRLRVDDNAGGGTVFTWSLRLPLSLEQTHAGVVSVLDSLAVHRHLFPSLRCVVFEDTPSNQLVIGRILELAGHSVTFYDRGDDAPAKIAAANADLVFLDLHMPGVSGLDVLRGLAVARTTGYVPPVVVLTADVTKNAAESSFAAGVMEYLVKPLSATKLLSVIERLHPAVERTSERELADA